MSLDRIEILTEFRKKIAGNAPIIGNGAGTGLSAKCAEAAGVDLIIIYNSARFRENPEVLVLCHGGPISSPADAAYIFERCPSIDGFYGATSMERLATEPR